MKYWSILLVFLAMEIKEVYERFRQSRIISLQLIISASKTKNERKFQTFLCDSHYLWQVFTVFMAWGSGLALSLLLLGAERLVSNWKNRLSMADDDWQ